MEADYSGVAPPRWSFQVARPTLRTFFQRGCRYPADLFVFFIETDQQEKLP